MRYIAWILTIILIGAVSVGSAETVVGNPKNTLSEKTIEYDGTVYHLKNRITSILLLGIDQREEERPENSLYRTGGQADFQMVVAIDETERTISMIPINRDTVVEMNILNVFGRSVGTSEMQICLAYSFGEGASMSGKMAVNTAAKFLRIPRIDYFYAIRLDGIQALNDFIGGIEVTLDEDFSIYDPEMTKGAAVLLNGTQAEYYLRGRYYVGDGSNAARMKRQMNYIEKVEEKIKNHLDDSARYLAELYDVLNEYVNTNMNRGLLINLGNSAKNDTVLPMYRIDGTTRVGADGFAEFYPDEESLMKTVLSVFYSPVSL